MSTAQRIEDILKETDLPVKYYEYAGTQPVYLVYNEEIEQRTDFGDNLSQNTLSFWQIHLFCPKTYDFRGKKKQIIQLLQTADFMVTDMVTLYEKETKTIHVVISCHIRESEE